jgi:nitrogen fixation NifU-like protein
MSDTAELYQTLIMDRSRHPRFAGRPADIVAEAQGDNPMCGDRVHVFVGPDGAVAHESRGCAIMTASADLMAEAVAGKAASEIAALRASFEQVVTTGTADPRLGDLNALAGVSEYRSRIRCATLPWSALVDALQAELAKPNQAELAKPNQTELAKPNQAELANFKQAELANNGQAALARNDGQEDHQHG